MLTESVEAIEALGRRANDRERAHAAAARAWLQGDFAGSIRRYGDILLDYPHDLLALQVAHVGDFFLGSSSMLRDRVAQVLPTWDTSTPGYGYVLGMYAFGLEETALYSRAEDIGRRALDINRRDAWAVHAVTHVMEMQGRLRDGIDWLTSRESDWSVNNGFAFHNWWHLALFHLEAGNYRARAGSLRPADPPDAVAGAAGDDRRDRAAVALGAALGECRRSLAGAGRVLGAVRRACLLRVQRCACGDGVRRCRPHGSRAANDCGDGAQGRQATDTNAMMTRDVGLPLARAVMAFAAGRYGDAIALLQPIRTIANRFGGSHAQRDLIHLTLVEAALRARHSRLARALVAERTQLKPSSPFNWQLTARSMDLNGDTAGAARALESAEARTKAQFGVHRAYA